MKYFLTILVLFGALPLLYAQKSDKFTLSTVVIDPGHGGTDAGAVFGKVYEKDIALDVALRFGRKIKSEFPNINVVYTRDTDVFIPLNERGKIANKAKSDFFI
ncbi:MAG: N-acetylmuramoyl-L-alanine amidase, partial [Rikenellaceae bacterium]